MVKTKLTTLIVICDSCENGGLFIQNLDKDICDKCGKVKAKVTYYDINEKHRILGGGHA